MNSLGAQLNDLRAFFFLSFFFFFFERFECGGGGLPLMETSLFCCYFVVGSLQSLSDKIHSVQKMSVLFGEPFGRKNTWFCVVDRSPLYFSF